MYFNFAIFFWSLIVSADYKTYTWQELSRQAPLTSTKIDGKNLKSVLKYAPDKQSWEDRANSVRKGILAGANFTKFPNRTALNVIQYDVVERSDYVIKNIAFEATPGFFVTGNLFVPTKIEGPLPAVLISHGHFGPWGGYARTLPENQILATRLAEMGAVVFIYDMVGWGDSQQLDHPDSYGFLGIGNQDKFKDGTKNTLLRVQLWDSIRSLDFLLSLKNKSGDPLVDSQRVGVAGASGGATQSLYLASIDSRVTAAALVVMITAGFTGNDYCEDGLPVHKVQGQGSTNNVEMAATFAPKPLMIISDGQDWTRWFPKNEYAYVKKIWSYYGAYDYVLNFHYADEGHDYGKNKRARTYDFFSTAFGLKRLPNLNESEGKNPEGVVLEKTDSLHVFNKDHVKPNVPMTHL